MNPSPIFNYHRDMIKLYGHQSSLALGWRDAESQLSRFKVLGGIADLNNCSVLDAGCGYADLLPYLRKLYPALGDYYGIEQIPELLNKAVVQQGNEMGVFFIAGNFMTAEIPVTDYVLVSGSLNYTNPEPNYIFNAITVLFSCCKQGLGFNLLSNVPYKGFLTAYNPQEITAYCRTFSKHVVLKTDYSDEDFTIFIYK